MYSSGSGDEGHSCLSRTDPAAKIYASRIPFQLQCLTKRFMILNYNIRTLENIHI